MMPGETNLSLLLKSIQPILREGEYVFCSIDRQNLPFFMADAIGIFQEEEGTTLILSRKRAMLVVGNRPHNRSINSSMCIGFMLPLGVA